MLEEPESRKDINVLTAQLVHLITELGPDIPEISRRLGQFKESVRYRYKEKILGKGFGIFGSIDHEKLGLKRVVLFADFAPEYREYAQAVLTAMNELCYVVYFEKRMIDDDYLIMASVPSEYVEAFISFMVKLKENGLFTKLGTTTFDWFRNIPMRAELYNFDTGRWDFDWSPLTTSEAASHRPSERVKFDYTDLLILKELQIDATKTLTEMAKKLNVNYKMLVWHYRNHVRDRGMVRGYAEVWMGTKYDTRIEKALNRRHRYQKLVLVAKNLREVDRMKLMSAMNGLPFLWSESVGATCYACELFFPVEMVTEALQYLTKATANVKETTSIMFMDQTQALAFTISYKLFDHVEHKWTFNEAELLSRFDSLFAKIRETGGH
ncbi:MAG: hypothetical protein LYZ69_04795 [Nitrososphaerales archaeon]|nr:hypothetical protein [Nitrososphaerales archaeon]